MNDAGILQLYRRQRALTRLRTGEAGISIIELLVILAIVGTVISFAIPGFGNALNSYRARGGVAQLKSALTTARELAISQQRDIRLDFVDTNRITLTRIDRPAGETVVGDYYFEGGVQFVRFEDQPETPDPWGGTDDAVAFNGAESVHFRSDGALVDPDNTLTNGRVFIGMPNRPESAGVVSVFAATGRIRSYRLSGTTWTY